MDLRIYIKDENGELLNSCVVYQDGSDSEGAERIVELIGSEFNLDEDFLEN